MSSSSGGAGPAGDSQSYAGQTRPAGPDDTHGQDDGFTEPDGYTAAESAESGSGAADDWAAGRSNEPEDQATDRAPVPSYPVAPETRQRRAASWLRQGWPALLLALAVGGVIAFVVLQGNGPTADDSRVVASYGEHELTLAELAVLVGGSADAAPPADQTTAATLTTWLFAYALADELTARGAEISDAHRADAAISAQTQGFADGSVEHDYWATAQAAILALSDFAATAAEEQDSDWVLEIEYLCASHVLTAGQEEARQAKQRADAGEDFGALAAELSVEPAADPEGADSRGDLGCGPADRYVEDFVEGARSAQGAGIVGPVQTDFGWHVIEVRSMGPLTGGSHTELTDEEIEAAVEQALQAVVLEVAEGVFADVLHEAAHRISDQAFLDDRFGIWDENLSGVLPPG